MGISRTELYKLTLSEFLNAWKGYSDEKGRDRQIQFEAARLVLSGFVKKTPKFDWDQKEETQPYTLEEKRQIAEAHEGKTYKPI